MSEAKINPGNHSEQSSTGSFRFEKQILNTSSIGVLITRISDGTILYANKAVGNLLGIAGTDTIIGKPVPDFYWDPADRQKLLELFRNEGSVTSTEIRARKENGNILWVSISLQPFLFEGEQTLLAEIVDNTDRKLAEDEIKASQQKLSLLIDSSPLAVIEWNTKFEVVSWNPAAERIFGYSFEEAKGRHAAGLIVPAEYKAAVDDVWANLLKQTGGTRSTNGNVTKDGRAITCEWYNTPLTGSDGKVFGVSSLVEDVTDSKQAEEKAFQLQSAMEQTGDGIALADLNGNIVYSNPAWAEIHGYAVNEILGKHLSIFHTQEQLEQEVIPFNNKVMELGRYSSEISHLRKDGSTFPTLMTTVVQKDENGNAIGLIGTIRDITERKEALERLNESEARYQLLSEATIEGVVIHDKGILLDANQTFAKMFGYNQAEVIGMSALDFLTPDSREITSQNIRSGYEKPYDVTGLRKDGSTFPVEITGKAIPYQGLTARVTALRDITERKQLEREIEEGFERRGYQVQISTEISQEIASASEINDLFDRVVTLTKERFGYYHTQLLRYDARQDAVVLVNGYGETGQKMLVLGHQMPLGSGLIGTAAENGKTVLRPILADDSDWQPNPLLPETKGEIAVPIKFGEQILGVLDVQSNKAGALTEDDRLLLEGLCGQIAIAMHNAELVETIRQNEARLAEAASIAQLGYWEFDTQTDTYTFTDQFYALLRTTAEREGGYQMSSKEYIRKFMHPDDRYMVNNEIQKSIETPDVDQIGKFENRFIRADGSEGYVAGRSRVVKDAQGRTVKTIGFNQDITERKQAEARLAEALKTARLANWEYDVAKDLFTFNDQFYSIFRTTAEKVGGYQLSSARYAELFVYPDDMEVVGAEIGKALNSTERVYTASIDHRIVYADGDIGYITVKLTVERDENGKITRYYGANQDITERKQAEEAIRRSEKEMAERLEEISHLYRVMSHEGWKTYRSVTDLPEGYVFDRADVKPVEGISLEDKQFASIPMRVMGGEVVGDLAVANDTENPISPEDLDFLQQVSDQIALALEGARLSAQTQFALAQTEKLAEISLRFAQATNLQELLAVVNQALGIPAINRSLLGVSNYSSIDELESIDIVANWWNGSGSEPSEIGRHYTQDTLNVLPMLKSNTTLFFNDTFNDDRIDSITMKMFVRQNIRAAAVLPLFLGARQIGVLFLEAAEPHEFTQDEIRLFGALAPQIATVLENRIQFERAQKQAERESKLNVISQKIQSATTVEAVLQIAARELGHALGAPMTVAQLNMKDKQ